MKHYRLILLILLNSLWIILSGCQPENTTYHPQEGPLKTRWSDEVQPGKTWQEYPRPQMVRPNWKNLNGLWEYAITSATLNHPDSMQGRILVPYPVESALSGVMKRLSSDQKLWYQKQLKIPIHKKSRKVLLHFEAVDWEMKAWLDGQEIGT
ncbi:MAG: beta-galactosidase, partial [Bacteroidales bacterium]|nr:beta-galactosidase [Bacteroidales bacterium]